MFLDGDCSAERGTGGGGGRGALDGRETSITGHYLDRPFHPSSSFITLFTMGHKNTCWKMLKPDWSKDQTASQNRPPVPPEHVNNGKDSLESELL